MVDVQDGGLLAQAATLAGATVAIVKHSGRRGTHQEFEALVQGLEAVTLEYPNNIYVQNFSQCDIFARRTAQVIIWQRDNITSVDDAVVAAFS